MNDKFQDSAFLNFVDLAVTFPIIYTVRTIVTENHSKMFTNSY